MARIVCLGDLCIDEIITCATYPEPGGESEVLGSQKRLGGSAANCAAVLAKLGIRVSLIARLGFEGQWLKDSLARVGVEISGLEVDPTLPTGVVRVFITPDGERTMFCQRGANTALQADNLRDLLSGSEILHISGYALMEPSPRQTAVAAIELARQLGLTVAVDPGVAAVHTPAAREALSELWGKIDIVFPNELELNVLTGGEGAPFLIRAGVKEVVLTRGAEGAEVYSMVGHVRAPAFPAEVVDTTGAGDAFSAGYLAGLLWGFPPEKRLELGNRLGALAVGTPGGSFGLKVPPLR